MREFRWLQGAAMMALCAGCAATADEDTAVGARAETLLDLHCGPVPTDPLIRNMIPPIEGTRMCRQSTDVDPNETVTFEERSCDDGKTQISIRSYEVSFNMASNRSWQGGKCDWGQLEGTVVCRTDITSDPDEETSDQSVVSDNIWIAIEPGGSSPTTLVIPCPSNHPFAVRASSAFHWKGTVDIYED